MPRRPKPLLHAGLLLVAAALLIAVVDVLSRLNLIERAVGGLVAQAAARRLSHAIAGSRWALALLALGLALLGLGALGASRRAARRIGRSMRGPRRARPPRRRPARARPRR